MKTIKKILKIDLNWYSCLHLWTWTNPNNIKNVINIISQRFINTIFRWKSINEQEKYIEWIRKTIKRIWKWKIDFDDFISEMKLLSFYRMRKYYIKSKNDLKKNKKIIKKAYLLSIERDRIFWRKYEPKTPYNQWNYRINYYIKDMFKSAFQWIKNFNTNQTVNFFKKNKHTLDLPLYKMNYPKKEFQI